MITIRVSSHNLFINTLRFRQERKERYERVCILCETGDIEDEFHFICKCCFYSDIQVKFIVKFIDNLYHPSKYAKIRRTTLSTTQKTMDKTASYIKLSTQRRISNM